MKRFIALLLASFLLIPTLSIADQQVRGYTRSDGTYVQGYTRSSPNSTVRDNYSYKGNSNPYTGSTGSNYYRDNPTSEYYGSSKSRRSSSIFGND